ncbi:Kinesin-4 [Hordeum vulgare]|nr:Kinesin-4 [Hordeum vulgare]
MAASRTSFLSRGIVVAGDVNMIGMFLGGNPRSGSTGSDDDDAFNDVLPPGSIVLEQVLAGGDKRKSGVTFTARPMADPGGMVLRSFADGRVWMNTCRMVELSDTVVASMAGLARSLH